MLLKLFIPENHHFCVKVGVAATRKSLLGVVGYHAVLTPLRPASIPPGDEKGIKKFKWEA
jgi:hypothetical protein